MVAGICQVTDTHTPTPIMLPEVPRGTVPSITVHPGQPTPKPSTSLAVTTWPAVLHYSVMNPGKPSSEAYMGEGIINMLNQVISRVARYQVSPPIDYALFPLKVYNSEPLHHTSWSFIATNSYYLIYKIFAVSKF